MKKKRGHTPQSVLKRLRHYSNKRRLPAMQRYGITTDKALGVPVKRLRIIARDTLGDHGLALQLWVTGVHEARLLATMIENPHQTHEKQLERWLKTVDSWDLCDQLCNNVARHTPYAYRKAFEWSEREPEFQKRAGFALMASLAVHDKDAPDYQMEAFFTPILEQCTDERNYVKKAVNWALRQVGKRNPHLRKKAIATAEKMLKKESRSAKWIAFDALRELNKK